MILFLLALTATLQPAVPTVGDPITVTFPAPVMLDASESYEIVSQRGNVAVIRTFRPEPFSISGVAGKVRFRNMTVPMRSVLKQNDALEPAPLVPPAVPPLPRAPFIAIGIASGIAAIAWAGVWWLARRAAKPAVVVPIVAPAQRYRTAIDQLRRNSRAPHRWATLADETRIYLASLDSELGVELTTTELLARLGYGAATAVSEAPAATQTQSIVTILTQGDLEKFSPWGAAPLDFESIANAALGLIHEEQVAA
ncbi:MAG: hypothetical protein JJE51_10300 [Thermoanaerobaculia bacterium]|nr:hypothetical protein [Thermoanaerobaculia bacterium]